MNSENDSPQHGSSSQSDSSSPQYSTSSPRRDSTSPDVASDTSTNSLPSGSSPLEPRGVNMARAASDTTSSAQKDSGTLKNGATSSQAAARGAATAASAASTADVAERRRWQLLGNRLLAFLGVGLVTAGVVFFFAYNWAELHRFTKLGIALGALCASAGFALFSKHAHPGSLTAAAPKPPSIGWRAALFGTALLLGATLALIGQTYQTGADLWELFAVWAVLITPFALLARGPETWLLWLAVANTGIVLWLRDPWFFSTYKDSLPMQLLCGISFNAGCLALAEYAARSPLFTPSRSLPQFAAFATLGPLCLAACGGLFDTEDFGHFIPMFIAAAALCLAFYRRYRFDLVMLGLAGFSVIAFLSTALYRALEGNAYLELSFNGLFVIGASAYFGQWLLKQQRAQRPEPQAASDAPAPKQAEHAPSTDNAAAPIPQAANASALAPDAQATAIPPPATAPTTAGTSADASAASSPMWLNAVQAIAAWIAATMITSPFIGLGFLHPTILGANGLGFIALALFLFFKKRDSVFFTQGALALSITGQILTAFALTAAAADDGAGGGFLSFDRPLLAVKLSLIPALLLSLPRTTLLHRTLCLSWSVIALLTIVDPSYGNILRVGLGFCVLATLLWLTHPHWAAHKLGEYLRAIAHTCTLYAATSLWTGYIFTQSFFFNSVAAKAVLEQLRVVFHERSIGAAVLLLFVVSFFTRKLLGSSSPHSQRLATVLLGAAALLAFLTHGDSSLLLGTSLLLVTFAVRQSAWFRLMLAALLAVIWLMYHNTQQTLLARSLTLIGSGALLLALRQGLHWLQTCGNGPLTLRRKSAVQTQAQALAPPHQAAPPALEPHARQIKLAYLGPAFALAALLCLWGIWGHERTLAHGQPVIVRLAPVDPRSLMQGDFMALRFAIDDEIQSTLPKHYEYAKWAKKNRARYAYLALDSQNRATALHSTGPSADALPEGAAVAIKLRGKPRSPSIGPNAFFFQEGHAKRYELARWAELRVTRNGKALLLNLRGENGEMLGETKR